MIRKMLKIILCLLISLGCMMTHQSIEKTYTNTSLETRVLAKKKTTKKKTTKKKTTKKKTTKKKTSKKKTTKKKTTKKKTKSLTASLSTKGNYYNEKVYLTASSSGGSGTKKYQFTYTHNGKKKTLKKYSTTKSISFTPKGTGKYTFTVIVRDSKKKTKTISRTINVTKRILPVYVSMGLSSQNIGRGQAITISGSSSGGYGNKVYQYFYTLNNQNILICDWTSSSSIQWIPPVEGNYSITVAAKDTIGTIATTSNSLAVYDFALNMNAIEYLTVGTTLKINCYKSTEAVLSYSSSNQTVCKVDSTYGFLMPISQGSATITVTASFGGAKRSASFQVNVTDNPNVLVGCDISKYQGDIDGAKLKTTGMDYVIIRAGHGVESDQFFVRNVQQCLANGLKFGVYWYSEAKDIMQASQEANALLAQLRAAGVSPGSTLFEFPIYYDLENSTQINTIGVEGVKYVTDAFTNTLIAQGISENAIGIYANKTWYEKYLNDPYYTRFVGRLWYARYNKIGGNPTFNWTNANNQSQMTAHMWQVGSGFEYVPGVSSKRLDMDYYYINN